MFVCESALSEAAAVRACDGFETTSSLCFENCMYTGCELGTEIIIYWNTKENVMFELKKLNCLLFGEARENVTLSSRQLMNKAA